jgi:hypothetical protein
VKDDHGGPVEGAARHIGRELAYTDSEGRFLVRFSRHGPFPFSIAPDELLSNVVYEVVSAPSEVRADADDTAPGIQIIVRTASSKPRPDPAGTPIPR